jgi:transposase
MGKIVGSSGCELLKQDSLGRVRTPLEKRESSVRAFEAAGMSAARFARHHGRNYSTFCSWVKEVRLHGQAERLDVSEGGTSVRWLEAVVEGERVVREEPSALCVEWRSARWRVCSQSKVRLAVGFSSDFEILV